MAANGREIKVIWKEEKLGERRKEFHSIMVVEVPYSYILSWCSIVEFNFIVKYDIVFSLWFLNNSNIFFVLMEVK